MSLPPVDPPSGPHPTIPPFILDRQAPIQSRFGEILALVAFAFALGGVAVRYEGKAEWARERIARLEAKEETRAKLETADALRLQRIEDALARIERRLGR